MISLELHGADELEKLLQSYPARARRYLQAAGMLTVSDLTRQLRRVAPKRTGQGARSIRAQPPGGEPIAGGWLWRFFARSYMLFTVPPGTRPHEIRARRAGALRFYWAKGPRGPGIYFFRRVMHPGYKPSFDWRRVAIERTRRNMARLLTRARIETV